MAKKILIVDDEKRIRDLIVFRLESKGFEILDANCGTDALAQVDAHQPDLMVLDVMMPDMTGLDVCRQIRAKGISVKIVMLSAKVQKQDEEAGLAAGADLYMTKPFRAKQLIQKIEEVLGEEPESVAPQ